MAEYVGLESKAAKQRSLLANLEGDQQQALAVLAAICGSDVASELAGVTQAKVRDAVAVSRRRPTSGIATEPMQGVAS